MRVAHAPGMLGMFFPPPTLKETISYRSRHASLHMRHARAVMYVGIAHPRWWGNRSRQSQRMRNPQFYVSGKRPIVIFKYIIPKVKFRHLCYLPVKQNLVRNVITAVKLVIVQQCCETTAAMGLRDTCNMFTYWGRDKVAVFFPDDIFKCILFIKIYKYRLRFHWILFPSVQSRTSQPWFK